MNILVTGAAGLLGSQVAAALVEEGHRVRAVDFLLPSVEGAECYDKDMSRAEVCDEVAEGVECIAHLGAFHGKHLERNGGTKDERDFFAANVAGTFHLLGAAVAHNIPKLVWASSVVVYERENWRIFGVYSLSKVLGEEMCQFFSTEHGLSIIGLRFGTFGSEDFLHLGFGMLGTVAHGNMIATEEVVRLVLAAIATTSVHYGMYDAQTPLPFTTEDEWAYLQGRRTEVLAKYWPQHEELIKRHESYLPPAINTVRMDRTLHDLNVTVEHDFGWFLDELAKREANQAPR